MPDLFEVFAENAVEHPQELLELRLGHDPALVLFFTTEVEPAQLHWLDDPVVGGYVPCPGADCPLCRIGRTPSQQYLLPVLSLMARRVEVLRLPFVRKPGSLGAALLPHLRGEGVEQKLFILERVGSTTKVSVQPLAENADRCAGVIKGFVEAHQQGLKLVSAFPEYTAAELASLESVQRALVALGHVTPGAGGASGAGS